MKALLILAALVAQPLYAQSSRAPNPQPIGNPSRWIGEYDYPAAALIDRPEGAVAFSLSINAAGNVTGCVIRQSSGFAALDSATCSILARRARFKPAFVTEPGLRVYNGRVRWTAPDYSAGLSGPTFASMKDEDENGR